MKHLEIIQKQSVLHCAYQIIASADGKVDENRDYPAIELVLNTLDFSIHSWDSAVKMIPHDCFFHISMLSLADQKDFAQLMMQVSEMGGNTSLRKICAESLFALCNLAPEALQQA